MHFVPLRSPLPLPLISSTIERPVMDLKAKPAALAFERAKDVTAFANHLGGTLLIGALEDKPTGRLGSYIGLSQEEAKNCRNDYSKAVSQRCVPLPRFECEEYSHPDDGDKRIVVVNIWPSLNLIGVKVKADKNAEGWGETVYAYPVRSGTDSIFLQPMELAMYMTPEVRRNTVLLSRVDVGALVRIVIMENGVDFTARFVSVEEESNLVRFKSLDEVTSVHLPLDRVSTIYQDPQGHWQMAMHRYRR